MELAQEDQDAIKLAQGTVPDCPPEDSGQLSSPLTRMDGGTPSDSATNFSEFFDAQGASDYEYRLNTVNSREEYYPSQTSHLDNEFLLSPMVIYQGIPNKFEVLVG